MLIDENLGTLALGAMGDSVTNKVLSTLWRKSYPRVLTAAQLIGTVAGAAGDAGIEFFEDTETLGKIFNPVVDSTCTLDLLSPLEGYIPSKHLFQIECIDAFANDNYVFLSFLENRKGESLIGKAKGAEVTIFENLGTMSLGDGLGMQKTKNLLFHEVNEEYDRFITHALFVGSSAALDSQIHINCDGSFRGSMYNHQTAVYAKRDTWLPANIYIPKGATLGISCENAFAADAWLGLRICNLVPTRMAAEIEASKPEPI